MVEVAKPDYLSLVNKGGSGFNISELVTSIVAAEIEPKRALQSEKKQNSDNAISGIGYLNSASSYAKNQFDARLTDNYFSVSSSNPSAISIVSTDETKLSDALRSMSNVSTAKSMVYELPGFALTDTFTETLSIDFGKWEQISTTSSSNTSSVTSGKTYKIVSAGSDGNSFDGYTRDPHDPNANVQFLEQDNSELSVGKFFRASQSFTSTDFVFQEVDNYEFTEKAGNSTVTVNSDNSTLTVQQMVILLDAVDGINAQLIQKIEGGAEYSIILTSENTGTDNGFKISSSLSGDAGERWQTSLFPSEQNASDNALKQSATNAEFELDGVSFTRSSNSIADVIEGATINLLSDLEGTTAISVNRSQLSTITSINEIITSLNEFKAEIDRLTYIDVEGDENGPLAMDPAVTRIKSNFKKLTIEPLAGYGPDNIYLTQLGIKTNESGEYYFDETIFNKTWANNPEYFNALKSENISANVATSNVTKNQFTSVPSNKYVVQNDGGQWKFGDTNLTREDYNGGSRFTSSTYAGLVIDTVETNPAAFSVYIGKSFADKISEFMSSILDLNSSIVNAETAYRATSTDIDAKLAEIDEREKLLTTRYTTQFGAMEQSMSQFNSTKSMLENFVEAWKKQK